MFSNLATIFLACHYVIPALAAPYVPLPLERRNASLSSPTIITTVRSANGTDVTSSFRTMVYFQSDTVTPTANLTGRAPKMIRQINYCQSPYADFLGSTCSRAGETEASMVDYTVRCKEETIPHYRAIVAHLVDGMPRPEPRYFREEGSCLAEEICVDSMPHQRQEIPIATCVDIRAFLKDPDENDMIRAGAAAHGTSVRHYVGNALRAVAKKRIGVITSSQQGKKPLGLQRLEVDVGPESGGSKVEEQTCSDCFGLRTQPAAPDADFLKIEATLLATAATAGIIWVSVFAG